MSVSLIQNVKRMEYTIKLDSSSSKAKSVLTWLLSLSKEYDFLTISKENEMEDIEELTIEQKAELNRRFEYVLQNPTEGKAWSEIEAQLLGG